MTDKNIRKRLLMVMRILQKFNSQALTINEIISQLEKYYYPARFERRAIYKDIDELKDFDLVKVEYGECNTKYVKWIGTDVFHIS